MSIQRLTPANAGCIYDSHHGHYIVPFVIGYAGQSGRPTDPFVLWAINSYSQHCHDPAYPNDALIEECEAAIVWLNEYVRPEGYFFDWNDGDFGLWQDEFDLANNTNPEQFAQRAKKGDD